MPSTKFQKTRTETALWCIRNHRPPPASLSGRGGEVVYMFNLTANWSETSVTFSMHVFEFFQNFTVCLQNCTVLLLLVVDFIYLFFVDRNFFIIILLKLLYISFPRFYHGKSSYQQTLRYLTTQKEYSGFCSLTYFN